MKMKTSFLFGLLVIFHSVEAAAVQNEDFGCSGDWKIDPQNRQCYLISEQYARFDVAEKSCKDMSSSLASILSFDELLFVLRLISVQRQKCRSLDDCLNYWIGFRKQDCNSVQGWSWINGSPLFNKPLVWVTGFPSHKFCCGTLSVLSEPGLLRDYWKDENCDKPMRYICKRELSAVKEVRNNRSAIFAPDSTKITHELSPEKKVMQDRTTGNPSDNNKITHAPTQGFVQPPGSNYAYKILHEILDNTAAAQRCRSFNNAQLAMIDSSIENEIVTNYLKDEFAKNSSLCASDYWPDKNQVVWINGQTRDPGNCDTPYFWMTADGVQIPMKYTNWYPLQPDCRGRIENCIQTGYGFDYKWNDFRCGGELCALCQKDVKAKM